MHHGRVPLGCQVEEEDDEVKRLPAYRTACERVQQRTNGVLVHPLGCRHAAVCSRFSSGSWENR
jgi:hypothetical protein